MRYKTLCSYNGIMLKNYKYKHMYVKFGNKNKEGNKRYIPKYFWQLSLSNRITYQLFLFYLSPRIFQIFHNEHVLPL